MMSSDEFLDALLTLPTLYKPLISPDGAWAAWTWYRAGPAADVFVAPTDGSSAPVRMTDTPEDTLVVSWTPDSRAVLVEQDQNGDERVQLFRIDLGRPCVMQPLTEPRPDYFLRGGQLHPNGRWLFYTANFDSTTGQPIEPSWVYRHDLATGERVPLARPEKSSSFEPYLNQSGTLILYNRQDLHPSGSQVWLVDIDGQHDREIVNCGAESKVVASWLPDDRLLVLAEHGTYRRLGIWQADREDLRWIVDDPTRNLEQAFVPVGSRRPVAVVVEVRDARIHSSLIDLDSEQEIRLPALLGNLTPLRALNDDEWVGVYYSSIHPPDLVRFSLTDVRPEAFLSLTRIWERAALQPQDLVAAEDFRWNSIDGRPIQGWLYRAPRQPRGTIVLVHGGPTAHSEEKLSPQAQFFVAQGFNVLEPNYRGSTGFGLEFQEAIKEQGWGAIEQDDIRTGIEALIAAGIAEHGKVGVTGTSYGGYSSWCAITRYPADLVAAAAPICGMTDLVVDYYTTRPDLRTYSEEMLGGHPDQVPDRYRERSPIQFVDNIRGQLLIVQGLHDPNVTVENVRAVVEALQRASIEYQLLAFDDEGHGIVRPKNQKTLYRRLASFFDEAFDRMPNHDDSKSID